MQKNQYLSYQDVFLLPRYSPYNSRSEADTSVKLGNNTFKVAAVPANMKCTINTKLAKWMSENDYFYIMHRFNANENDLPNTDNKKFIELANKEEWKNISISVGVKEEDRELLKWVVEKEYIVDYITIDIAHAQSIRMKEMLEFIKGLIFRSKISPGRTVWTSVALEYKPFIIAGNVATPSGVNDLEEWGADATKVGIAQGDACTTYGQTGFGLPMFTCMYDCAYSAKKPMIADGGVRMNGDFAKAIRAGGTMVMAGSVFAACIDSPAETVVKTFFTDEAHYKKRRMQGEPAYDQGVTNKTYKVYFGSASAANKGHKHHVEGRVVELECNGMTYEQKLNEIQECIQSSISYAGGDIRTVNWGVRYNHSR